MAIQSFRDRATQDVYEGRKCRRFVQIERALQRRLRTLDLVETLKDLAALPGNRLEPLKGDRKGQYSIRVNDQFRLCFVWGERGPEQVECVDYH